HRRAPQDAIDIDARLPELFFEIDAVAHQSASIDKCPFGIDRRKAILGGQLRDNRVVRVGEIVGWKNQPRVGLFRRSGHCGLDVAGGVQTGTAASRQVLKAGPPATISSTCARSNSSDSAGNLL